MNNFVKEKLAMEVNRETVKTYSTDFLVVRILNDKC